MVLDTSWHLWDGLVPGAWPEVGQHGTHRQLGSNKKREGENCRVSSQRRL